MPKNLINYLKAIRCFPPVNTTKPSFTKLVIITETISGWTQLLVREYPPWIATASTVDVTASTGDSTKLKIDPNKTQTDYFQINSIPVYVSQN